MDISLITKITNARHKYLLYKWPATYIYIYIYINVYINGHFPDYTTPTKPQ